jgi:hypothetical protein
VNAEPKRILLRMDSDPRFAAAAGGAVRFLAEAAGMPEEVCKEFQEAMVRACTTTFDARPKEPHTLEFLLFGDRLEVAIDADAGAHAIRLIRSVVPQR